MSESPDAGLEAIAQARLPTSVAEFDLRVFLVDDKEHLAITLGDPGAAEQPLVRLHSECLTGDALFSLRCDCGFQLEHALQRIAAEGCGACSLCVVRTPFHAKNFAGLDDRRSAQNPPTASESTSRRRLASSSNVATNPAARTLGSHSQYARMKLPMDANTSGSEFQMSAAPSPSLSTA